MTVLTGDARRRSVQVHKRVRFSTHRGVPMRLRPAQAAKVGAHAATKKGA